MPPKGRAPAKKTPAAAAAVDKTAERIDKFEAMRARARSSPFEIRGHVEPLVLDAFDPPVTARYPASLEAKLELDEAAANMRIAAILRIYLGGEQFARVVRAFDKFDDPEALLLGLVLQLLDHFNGSGAGDVPGGSQAS